MVQLGFYHAPEVLQAHSWFHDKNLLLFLCRDYRGSRSSLFDGIEEGINRASSSYSTLEISEHDNEMAVDGLQDKVNILKRVCIYVNLRLDLISFSHLFFLN